VGGANIALIREEVSVQMEGMVERIRGVVA
jgi:hypothetical protein